MSHGEVFHDFSEEGDGFWPLVLLVNIFYYVILLEKWEKLIPAFPERHESL